MTIAAGFVCNDGILLCADTEYSGGSKVYKEKIFSRHFDGGTAVFVIAGHESHAKMVIRDCEYEFADASMKRSLKNVERIFREALKPIYESYVTQAADPWTADFSVLMAVRLHGCVPALFVSTSESVDVVDTFVCRGTGNYPGEYIISRAYDPFISIRIASVIALQALSAAKKHSTGVGGPSQFIVLTPGQISDVVSQDFDVAEEQIRLFENEVGQLLLTFGNGAVDESGFQKALVSFGHTLSGFRQKMLSRSDYLNFLQKISL
jgi:20S proteasome alpha/beta subunit